MARITISEQDLTVNDFEDITANIVYVPGIAVMGPLNKPILCNTIQEFKKNFGEEPYHFLSDQVYQEKTLAQAHEYEKSYLYACELIQAGFPVLFERAVNQYNFTRGNDAENYGWEEVTLTADTFVPYKYYLSVESETNNTVILHPIAETFDAEEHYYLPVPQSDGGTVTTIDSSVISSYYYALTGLMAYNSLDITRESVFSKLQDKWTYNIKYITSGGYPVLSDTTTYGKTWFGNDVVGPVSGKANLRLCRPIAMMMSMVAAVRGDCVALIDHDLDIDNILDVYTDINDILQYSSGNDSMIKQYFTLESNVTDEQLFTMTYSTPSNRLEEVTTKYAQICAPWGVYNAESKEGVAYTPSGTFKFPGSFAYLKSLANSINKYKNPNYVAIAGVVRGLVPSLQELCTQVTGAEAEAVQVRTKDYSSINPIVNVQNYGLCIWGNRTLFPNTNSSENPDGELSASSFLNIRVMAADVKKVIYAACKKYTFETNNTELWLKFKSDVEPTLEQMVANGGLEDYELQRRDTTQRATLSVYVKLYTLYAVEDFDVTIALTDSTVDQVQ